MLIIARRVFKARARAWFLWGQHTMNGSHFFLLLTDLVVDDAFKHERVGRKNVIFINSGNSVIEHVNVFKSNIRRKRTKFTVNHFGSNMASDTDVLLTLWANDNIICYAVLFKQRQNRFIFCHSVAGEHNVLCVTSRTSEGRQLILLRQSSLLIVCIDDFVQAFRRSASVLKSFSNLPLSEVRLYFFWASTTSFSSNGALRRPQLLVSSDPLDRCRDKYLYPHCKSEEYYVRRRCRGKK